MSSDGEAGTEASPEGNGATPPVWPGAASDLGGEPREDLTIAWPRTRPRRELAPHVEGPAHVEKRTDAQDPADAVRRWRDDVWRSLRRLGVPEDRLEDATQDVFIVVYRNWFAFEGRSTRKCWVYGIATRVAQQYRRHRSNRERNGDFSILEEKTTRGQWNSIDLDPYEATARREASRVLQELLDCLRKSHREVFVLRALESQTSAEVALVLGLTVKAVERRLARATEKLEKAWGRYQRRPR